MSGHSKWANIKYKKESADKRRGKIFSKLSRQISLAAREKGGDPETNSTLRMVIEKAKSLNMPKENIERAIKRGLGELEGVKYERVSYEALGPGGIAIIIEGVTDNKNRTLADIKQILNKNNGKLAKEGSVRWLFARKGVITLDPQEQETELTKNDIELKIIESGAEDFKWFDNYIDVYTKPEDLEKVKNALSSQGLKISDFSLDWVAKNPIEISDADKEKCRKLFESLNESESVQEIYSNTNL